MTDLSRMLQRTTGLGILALALPLAAEAQQEPPPLFPATQTLPSLAEGAASGLDADADPVVTALDAQAEERALWLDGGVPSAAAEALIDALVAAPSHGLPAARYRAERLSAMASALRDGSAGAADRAEFERAMKKALLAYGRDVSSGVLEPREVSKEIKVNPPRPEPQALVEGIAGAADPAAWLAGLAPGGEEYARLRRAYAEMQDLVAAGGWGPAVPGGPTLRPGDSGKRVEALRARLVAMGDLPPGAGEGATIAANEVASDAVQTIALSDPWIYDERVVEAVRRFQARHGLNTDGLVGPATLGALNTTAEERLGQIAANLERLRWLNRDLGDRHVMVNIAGFTMALVEDGRETFTSRVVVGQPTHQTPEFSDVMEHMVVNPSWNVPWSIATKEILPKLRQDRYYLDRNNMKLVGGPDPWFVDWWSVTPSTFPGRIKQKPGPGNALGRVKFMFPNDNAVYLHDTPSRSLFSKDMRAFSHGCVRVEKPIEFAHILLAPQESDPAAAFDAWQRSGRERWVQLAEHLPVHIGYRTAWIDEAGTPEFRTDIYGRDEAVVAALKRAGVELAAF